MKKLLTLILATFVLSTVSAQVIGAEGGEVIETKKETRVVKKTVVAETPKAPAKPKYAFINIEFALGTYFGYGCRLGFIKEDSKLGYYASGLLSMDGFGSKNDNGAYKDYYELSDEVSLKECGGQITAGVLYKLSKTFIVSAGLGYAQTSYDANFKYKDTSGKYTITEYKTLTLGGSGLCAEVGLTGIHNLGMTYSLGYTIMPSDIGPLKKKYGLLTVGVGYYF